MIRVPLPALPLLYSGLFLAAVLALWLLYERGRAARRRRDRQGLCQCRLCAEWIRNAGGAPLVRCPSCGALNEQNSTNDL